MVGCRLFGCDTKGVFKSLVGPRAKIQKARIISAKVEIADLGNKKINPLKESQEDHFTEFCALCRMDIKGRNAYMYGFLQAFCSPDCRDIQIALDQKSTEANITGRPAQEIGAKSVIPTPHPIKTSAVKKPAAAAGGNRRKSKPSRVACCAAPFFP